MATKYPKIRVFITKKGKFRAKVQTKEESFPYEVTVFSESWNNGKAGEYHKIILDKCKVLLEKIKSNLIEVSDEDIIRYVKEKYDCHIVSIYEGYVLTANSQEELVRKKGQVDSGQVLGFPLRQAVVLLMGK